MQEEHPVNLSCSFCGKHQREVRKLIAGPRVFICDECIGLCNQIIGEEVSRETPAATPESARGLMNGLVEREGNLCELLGEIGNHAGAAVPEFVGKALNELVHASSTLRSAMQAWTHGETGSVSAAEVSTWLRPCLERLGRTVEVLRALRPTLEGLIPGMRLKVVDEALGQIAEVRGLLVTVAEKEARETPRLD